MGSLHLPSVAGRLQAAAAVAQEGPISISASPSALASQLSALYVSSVGFLRPQSFPVSRVGSRVLTVSSALTGPARVNNTINIVFSVHHHQGRAGLLSARTHFTAHAIMDPYVCDHCRSQALMRLGSSNPSQGGQDHWHLVASHGICWAFLWAATWPANRAGQAGQAHQAHQAAQFGPPTGGALLPLLRAPASAPVVQSLGLPKKLLVSSTLALRALFLVFLRLT